MGIDVAGSLRRFQEPDGVAPLDRALGRKSALRWHTVLAVGLWALLWAGYNSGLEILTERGFPHNNLELIHGVRAFLPILGGWAAIVVILFRGGRLLQWLIGPLGLVLLFGMSGLVSSLTFSIEPLDAAYWGALYVSTVLVLLAISMVKDPLYDLRRVLEFTWMVGTALTFGLLGILPFLGQGALKGSYVVSHTVAGMAMSRNTGFARYAAISALVALSRIWEGKRIARLAWMAILGASSYALVISNGRTEVLGFIVSALAVMIVQKRRRTAFVLVGIAGATVLAFTKFYSDFFQYITRTGKIDLTLTGRTLIWSEAWEALWRSPWTAWAFRLTGTTCMDFICTMLFCRRFSRRAYWGALR